MVSTSSIYAGAMCRDHEEVACRITAAAVAINAMPRSKFDDRRASILQGGCADNMPSMVYVGDDAMRKMTNEMGVQ